MVTFSTRKKSPGVRGEKSRDCREEASSLRREEEATSSLDAATTCEVMENLLDRDGGFAKFYRNLSKTKQGGGRCFPHQSPRSAVSGLWMLSPARTFSPEARPHSGHFPGPH